MSVGTDAADALQSIIEEQQSLSTWHEQGVQAMIAEWAAIRESDAAKLKTMVEWPDDRTYIIDPLGEKISEAFADLLFGEDPTFTSAEAVQEQEKQQAAKQKAKDAAAALGQSTADAHPPLTPPPGATDESGKPPDKTKAPEDSELGPDRSAPPPDPDDKAGLGDDQERLDALVEANDLPSELRAAASMCSSEGEVWWRVYVDPGQMEFPIVDWHSRLNVRPFFKGRKLIAAAFFDEIFREEVSNQTTVFRYVEIQAEGYVRNLLYKGTPIALGTKMALTERPETEGLRDEWAHGYGMLAGRIPNKLGRDRRVGISDYAGVKDMLLSLNEATTIGHENARLTAKKRAVVPASAIDEEGTFDASEDVLVADNELDKELGAKPGASQFAILEYSFDAQALIEYKDDLANIILTRVGIAQQFIGSSKSSQMGGQAQSGTALRLRLIPTTLAANGKGRFWDDQLPKILMLMQQIDKLGEAQGGFGRNWKMAEEPPAVERETPLPEDEQEQVTRHATAVTAEIESRFTAIQDMHPDWDEQKVQEELDRIDKELKEFGAIGGKGGPGAPPASDIPGTHPGLHPDEVPSALGSHNGPPNPSPVPPQPGAQQ